MFAIFILCVRLDKIHTFHWAFIIKELTPSFKPREGQITVFMAQRLDSIYITHYSQFVRKKEGGGGNDFVPQTVAHEDTTEAKHFSQTPMLCDCTNNTRYKDKSCMKAVTVIWSTPVLHADKSVSTLIFFFRSPVLPERSPDT